MYNSPKVKSSSTLSLYNLCWTFLCPNSKVVKPTVPLPVQYFLYIGLLYRVLNRRWFVEIVSHFNY